MHIYGLLLVCKKKKILPLFIAIDRWKNEYNKYVQIDWNSVVCIEIITRYFITWILTQYVFSIFFFLSLYI